jgi:hypothetical protein
MAKSAVLVLADQLHIVADQIGRLERRLMAWHRQDQASQRCCQGKLFGPSLAPLLPSYLGSSHQSFKKTRGRRGDRRPSNGPRSLTKCGNEDLWRLP